jgi:uncharacterized membrane protein
MMYDWWGFGGWGVWITIVLTVVFLAAVIIGIVLLVLGLSRGRAESGAGPAPPIPGAAGDARDIVRRRYAAGESDREEYQQQLRDLGG